MGLGSFLLKGGFVYLSEGECGGDYVTGWRIVGLAYNLMVYLLVETGGGLESTDDYLSVKRSKRYKVEGR